jgi:hypothetical protein
MKTSLSGPTSFGPLLLVVTALAGCEVPSDTQTRQTNVPGQTASTNGRTEQTGSLSSAPVLASYSDVPTAESSPSGAELAAVRSVLTRLQYDSFAANAEHCGYIGLNEAGQIMLTPINRGSEASCELPQILAGMTLLASLHTHGTYSPYYASEFPTSDDMLSDMAQNVDGYISTPGGRLWHVDSDTRTVRQLCGRGCLPQDPDYRPEDDGPVEPMFTLADLRRWEQS